MQHFSGPIQRGGRTALLILAACAAASCGDAPTSARPADTGTAQSLPLLGGSSGVTLLQCAPAAEAQMVTRVVDTLGGTLQIGNTRVVIPANAVLAPTTFRMTIPASSYAEISVKAGDADHFLFQLPVMVSIDYGRCTDGLSPLHPVTAWHIDETSKALLENMGGTDLRLFHTITFFTGHLSGYAVAD